MTPLLARLSESKSVLGFEWPKCPTCSGSGVVKGEPCNDFFDGCAGTGCYDEPGPVILAALRWCMAKGVEVTILPAAVASGTVVHEHNGTEMGFALRLLRVVLSEDVSA